MKSAFDANVPRRKPRTRLGTMLAEIDAVAETPAEAETIESVEVTPDQPAAAEAKTDDRAARLKAKVRRASQKKQAKAKKKPAAKAKAIKPTAPVAKKTELTEAVTEPPATKAAAIEAPVQASVEHAAAEPAAPIATTVTETVSAPIVEAELPAAALADAPSAPVVQTLTAEPVAATAAVPEIARAAAPVLRQTESAVQDSRQLIAQLRERLRRSRRQQLPIAAPEATATRVKETVGVLQTELGRTQTERDELLREAETLRRNLGSKDARTTELEAELKTATEVARQRDQLAEAAIEESELMAVERDEALTRLAEMHEVHADRESVLGELEHDLTEARTVAREIQAQSQSLKDALQNTIADLEFARAELAREREERRRQEDRVRDLEDELGRTQSARSALVEIQRLVDAVP